MTALEMKQQLQCGGCDAALTELYGGDLAVNRERCIALIDRFVPLYGDREVRFFSVPGRTEISGNHTDHNNGKVLAASVNIDILAVAALADDGIIRVKSEGYREDLVDISRLDPAQVRKNSSGAIITGLCDWFSRNNYRFGGFCACTSSTVASGSGLSSSAAFEVAIAEILNVLYNDGKLTPMELAKAGKYSENVFFGKPCGLMDQAACAHGGLLYIDFGDSEKPVAEKLSLDLSKAGYSLFIVSCGASHADLTDDYAAVPREMKSCAALMGRETLRQCDEEDFKSRIPYMRGLVGDRAILRALHFFAENRRVELQREAIKQDKLDDFLKLVVESGNSSFKYLQNVYTNAASGEQGLSLALCITQQMGFTCRVHGGGFAGTIQAYVPLDRAEEYKFALERIFGDNSCMQLSIRRFGAVCFDCGGVYPCEA